jgi:threonine synthase
MTESGIWAFSERLKPFIKKEHRLSLNEGNTPLEENHSLADVLNLEKILLKREDQNPTGSHKDRGLSFQISAHLQDNKENFTISSSGNSSISAINLLKSRNEKLHIFLSENLSDEKISRLKTIFPNFEKKDFDFENFSFHFSKKPLSSAFKFSKTNNSVLLRGSTDIYGYEGFKTIGYEIENEDFDSIFIPTSSGTTAKGIYEGLNLKKPFHIVQTTKVNTLVNEFDQNYEKSESSIANSIVDKVGHRKLEINEIIEKTKGTGWAISDEEIKQAQNILQNEGIETSNESALTIAAIKKAKSEGWNIKKPLCIFTGTK